MQYKTSPTTPDKKPRQKRHPKSAPSSRVMLSLSAGLLELVDKAAEQDYTTRSDIIRQALLAYLRPQGRDLEKADLDTIFQILKRRQALAALNQELKEADKS